MENFAAISHADDIDGVGSAALIIRKYGVKPRRLIFVSHLREDVLYAERHIRRFGKGLTLFVTDLNPSRDNIDAYERIVSYVKRSGGRVFWFDHHPWGDDALNRIAKRCDIAIVGENERYCATEITQKELGIIDRFVNEFVRIVHYSDFNLKPKDRKALNAIKTYALGITYIKMGKSSAGKQLGLRRLANSISRGVLIDRFIANASRRFEKLNDERIEEMFKDLYFIGKNAVVGFSKEVQSTNAGTRLIARSKRDISIIVNVGNGKISLRSVKTDISKLAKALGGGGHPHAAGGRMDTRRYNGFRKRGDREVAVGYIRSCLVKKGMV